MAKTDELARIASVVARRMSGPLQADGPRVDSDPGLADLLDALELFIPQVLRGDFVEWETESLDGFLLAEAKKSAQGSLLLSGLAIIISDQTVTPFQIGLRRAGDGSLERADVLLGEPGAGALGISGPTCTAASVPTLLEGLSSRLSQVNWAYHAAYASHAADDS